MYVHCSIFSSTHPFPLVAILRDAPQSYRRPVGPWLPKNSVAPPSVAPETASAANLVQLFHWLAHVTKPRTPAPTDSTCFFQSNEERSQAHCVLNLRDKRRPAMSLRGWLALTVPSAADSSPALGLCDVTFCAPLLCYPFRVTGCYSKSKDPA